MRFERLTTPRHEQYAAAMTLYRLSFPPHEQREAASQEKILRNPDYFFNLIYDGAVFVGLLLCWKTTGFIYVEHLCIAPAMRNKQYGQKALALLKEEKKRLILEIDPPVDAVSIRRKGFYERNGFVINPYPHIHPPYHRDQAGHRLAILSFPEKIAPEIYDQFFQYLQNPVMAGACFAAPPAI